MRHRHLTALAFAALIGGCGGSTGSERKAVEKADRTYWEATARGDGAASCAAATGAFQREILGGPGTGGVSTGQDLGCADRVQGAYQDLGADNFATLTDYTVTKVEINGSKARITHKSPDGTTCTEALEKIGDQWKVAGQCAKNGG